MSTNAVQQQLDNNNIFLNYSYTKVFSGITSASAYKLGSTLYFTSPTLGGTWVDTIRVSTTVTFDYTPAGSGPTVAYNAAAPYSLFNNVKVLLGNNPQVNAHPYFFKILQDMRGYNRSGFASVNNQNSTIQNLVYSMPTIASGVNTITAYFDIPLRDHPNSYVGMLPLGAANSPVKVNLQVPASLAGADPLDALINTNGTITNVSGSTDVLFITRGSLAWHQNSGLPALNLLGLPTYQSTELQEINPMVSGQYKYSRFNLNYEIARMVGVVIDGVQSDKFASASNVIGFDMDTDENVSNSLVKYDSTNGGFAQYYLQLRETYGRDFDEGVFIFDTQAMNVVDSSLRTGVNSLNLDNAGGWPTAQYGYQLTSISSANSINPRVVSLVQYYNPAGIAVVQA